MNSRNLVSYLTALTLLFSLCAQSLAKGESNQEYEFMPINTIFQATDQEKDRQVHLANLYFLEINFNSETFVVPASREDLMVVLEAKTESDKNLIKLGYMILFSQLLEIEYVPKYISSDITSFQRYLELVSKEDIMITGVIRDKNTVNKKYFEKMYKKGNTKGNNIYILPMNFWNLIEKFNQENPDDIIDMNFDEIEDLPLGEILDIYKKMVPEEKWPIRYKKSKDLKLIQNINPTFPKLKYEMYDSNFGNLSFGSLTDQSGNLKFVIATYSKSGNNYEFRDIFTSELIRDKNGENKKYFKNQGFNTKKMLFTGFKKVSENPLKYFLEYPFLKRLVPYFEDIKSAEEFVEAYFTLPLEYQMDYSYFDFSKSPNVDPAWLAGRPTPAPYAELTIGSRGQEVLDMKRRFFELGYYRTDKYNDSFTKSTADTVRQFEKNNGLPVDGVADPAMLALLFSPKAVGK
ncbi:MAG: peptidoglycan-binding domain-containing protein [Bacillota bacterium]|nr:peptidoglycan-binding domain-containing protein [Bacillota bacterium]